MARKTEQMEQIALANYIVTEYPDVEFHSDTGSGMKMTVGQAKIQKALQGGRRGWPDLFIAEPRNHWHGLYIELKTEGVHLKKKDGTWANEHFAEQAEQMARLDAKGYACYFAGDFDEAKEIIDDYMGKEVPEDNTIDGEEVF